MKEHTILTHESSLMMVLAFLQQAIRELSDNEAIYSDKWGVTMDHAELDRLLVEAGLRNPDTRG